MARKATAKKATKKISKVKPKPYPKLKPLTDKKIKLKEIPKKPKLKRVRHVGGY